jgi:hypothetical protein
MQLKSAIKFSGDVRVHTEKVACLSTLLTYLNTEQENQPNKMKKINIIF